MFRPIHTARIATLSVLLLAAMALSACSTPAALTETSAATEAPAAQAGTPPEETAPAQPPATTEPPPAVTEAPAEAGSVSFSAEVMPILQNSCLRCHGGERTSGGFDLNTYTALMSGGQDGPAVVPGDPSSSPLVTLSQSGKMPKRGEKLTPEQIQVLIDWVNSGAPNN